MLVYKVNSNWCKRANCGCRLQEELQAAMLAAEEDERRISMIEQQTEEEALAKIRAERDEADGKRRRLMQEAERLAQVEEEKR